MDAFGMGTLVAHILCGLRPWKQKISGNIIRDKKNYDLLTSLGWRVFTVWECELRPRIREQTLWGLVQSITANTEPSK